MTQRWSAAREIRRRIAMVLATAGVLAWAGEAFGAWMTSMESKFVGLPYLGSMTADEVLQLAALAFASAAAILAVGVVLLARRQRMGRATVITGCTLVLLGQTLALTLAAIPIDAFYYQPPPSLAFDWPLMIFPLLTILLLLESTANAAANVPDVQETAHE
ncbi:hypothetical protein [Nocardia concava]|uniref:hypothetical protein n=1 Tax=Nocardia concava TaxID=257281 RepID=UPI000302F1EE|nr:hypothetical protein [Nocardia concava]